MQFTNMSQYILDKYQVRKNKKQKEKFRQLLCEDLQEAGYSPKVESKWNLLKCHNVVVGDPEKAKVLVTAHYDTCVVLPFPNFITPRNMIPYILYQFALVIVMVAVMIGVTVGAQLLLDYFLYDSGFYLPWIGLLSILLMEWLLFFGKANKHTANDNTSGVISILETAHRIPEELRDKVCFVFFDNEELGMLGSGAFVSIHETTRKDTLVLNCDCVSDGDSLQLFPSKAVKKNQSLSELLEGALEETGEKETEYVRSFGFYPSDNMSFKYGVGICSLKKGPVGYYMNRIHTSKDTIFDEKNIEQIISILTKVIEKI